MKEIQEDKFSKLNINIVSRAEAILGKAQKRKIFVVALSAVVVLTGLVSTIFLSQSFKNISLGEESDIQMISAPLAAASAKKSNIVIPSGTVKANPFLPYKELGKSGRSTDVPAYSLVEPPEMVNENSDAARVMDTIVSGILYDKYSPSAILNIEGNDYLVKKGDVVNNYKVINIAQDSVTVKLGENSYKAGIGEILTEGSIHHNDVSNLNNKFGGVK